MIWRMLVFLLSLLLFVLGIIMAYVGLSNIFCGIIENYPIIAIIGIVITVIGGGGLGINFIKK